VNSWVDGQGGMSSGKAPPSFAGPSTSVFFSQATIYEKLNSASRNNPSRTSSHVRQSWDRSAEARPRMDAIEIEARSIGSSKLAAGRHRSPSEQVLGQKQLVIRSGTTSQHQLPRYTVPPGGPAAGGLAWIGHRAAGFSRASLAVALQLCRQAGRCAHQFSAASRLGVGACRGRLSSTLRPPNGCSPWPLEITQPRQAVEPV